MNITYPRAIMTRTELIEFGIPAIIVDRAIKSEFSYEFAEKSGKGKTAKWLIHTRGFEAWRKESNEEN